MKPFSSGSGGTGRPSRFEKEFGPERFRNWAIGPEPKLSHFGSPPLWISLFLSVAGTKPPAPATGRAWT
jgi:hypothetical protein